MPGHPSHHATLTVNEPSLNHPHTAGSSDVSATKMSADTTFEASTRKVCDEFNLDVSDWQMRVVENFIEPLVCSLSVRAQHRDAMLLMVSDLQRFSSRVLYLAARQLRASRSVFPTIGEAMRVLEEIHKAEYRAEVLVLGHPHLMAWRAHLVAIGDQDGIKRLDGLQPYDEFSPQSEYRSRQQIDGNLLDDVLAQQAAAIKQPEVEA